MNYRLYKKLAPYYDFIYSFKDYKGEVKYQLQLIKKYKKSSGKDLLEVACGTGRYLEFFEKKFNCTGIDLNSAMLRIAKKRVKKSKLLRRDMLTMNLGKKFDIVACLFSSIGYIHGRKNLKKVIQNFSDHLRPGGILLISPWISKENFEVGMPHMQTYEDKDIKLARAVVSELKRKNISVMNYNWMIAEKNKMVRHVDNDIHELAMHSNREFMDAMNRAGIHGKFIQRHKHGRGLYIGVKPA